MENIIPKDIIKVIQKKKLIRRYLMMIIALFISALVYNLFLIPTGIVSGGVGGIAIITKYLYNWDPSIVIFLISASLVILSFMYLGVERTSGTIVATILYPLFVEITSKMVIGLNMDTSDLLIISVFVGVIGGFANGVMCKTGFSNGGLPIISQILYKYFKISVSTTSLVLNGIVVFVGGLFFGWTMVMYAIIILFLNSFMLDRIILGISNNKAFYIITTETELVKKYIIEKLGHSVTVFDVKGGFMAKKRNVLMTVIPSREYFMVTEGIKEIDKDAFFLACDAYQVEGGK